MRGRLWRAWVRWGETRQRLARRRWPQSMRYVAHGWPLRPDQCPCDVDFGEFLEARAVRGQRIFHFGTGKHHHVGLRNLEADWRNDILGLTISPREHQAYVTRVIREPALGVHYKVLFADIHSLTPAALPEFDLVTLFHLCEFGDPESGGRVLDDAGVLRTFVGKLTPGGRLFLYRKSFGYARASALLAECAAATGLTHVEDFRSLSIYRVPGQSDRHT
jgi:hypothetical protein